MSKKIEKTTEKHDIVTEPSKTRPWLPHLVAIAVFLLSCIIYFYPQLQGKVISQSDIVNWQGASHEALSFKEKTGDETLWTNSMFGGMPTYQICADSNEKNSLKYLNSLLMGFMNAPIGFFLCAMLATYLGLILLGISPWIAMIAGVCFAFSPYTMILYEAGHNTKINTIALSGLVLAGVIMTFRGRLVFGGICFAVGMGLSLLANHVQMTYYLGIMVALYGIFRLVKAIKLGMVPAFLKQCLVLIFGLLLAVLTSSLNLFMTYDYAKDTIRGDDILTKSTEGKSSGEVKGLDWDYATDWSHSPLELLTVAVPGILGGSSSEEVGPKSAFAQELRAKGYGGGKSIQAPLYWGELPFTSGPVYFGVIALLFFILGAIVVRGSTKWWLVAATLLTMLLSLGKNAEWFTRLWFDYFPMYSKFRAPNSIMTITSIFAIFLGAFFLDGVLKKKYEKETILKALKYGGGALVGLLLLLGIFGPMMFSFTTAGDARYQEMGLVPALIDDRKSLLMRDAFKGLFLVLAALGLLWAFIQEKIKSNIFIIGLTLLTIIDLWSIGKKYLDADRFVSKKESASNTVPRPVDLEIMKDTDPHYRVLDYSINTFNSAQSSYFHKTIGGYHAAKLRRIQDVIEKYFSGDNFGLTVPSMLNTKYFIMPGASENEPPVAKLNESHAGNAWFVSDWVIVSTANQELDSIGGIIPNKTAIIHEEFNDYLKGINPTDSSSSIRLTSYAPNELKYASKSDSEQLAVFSEVWYPKGWVATIDGKEVPYIRANYLLRALKVPAGSHEIVFKFEPKAYSQFSSLTLLSSLALLLLLLGTIYYSWNHKRKEENLPSWF